MLYGCYILDDEFHAIEVLKEYIELAPDLYLVGHSQNPIEALSVVNDISPDILFLDINMPKLDGITFTNLLTTSIKIVFTTASRDFALEAFSKNAFDYLLKPISQERFLQCINKIKSTMITALKPQEMTASKPSFIFVRSQSKGKIIKIDFENIFYIESNDNNLIFSLLNVKHHSYFTLKEVLVNLPEENFIRIHKSFIVNHDKIDFIYGNQVILTDKTVLVVGSTYKAKFFDHITKNSLNLKKSINNS